MKKVLLSSLAVVSSMILFQNCSPVKFSAADGNVLNKQGAVSNSDLPPETGSADDPRADVISLKQDCKDGLHAATTEERNHEFSMLIMNDAGDRFILGGSHKIVADTVGKISMFGGNVAIWAKSVAGIETQLGGSLYISTEEMGEFGGSFAGNVCIETNSFDGLQTGFGGNFYLRSKTGEKIDGRGKQMFLAAGNYYFEGVTIDSLQSIGGVVEIRDSEIALLNLPLGGRYLIVNSKIGRLENVIGAEVILVNSQVDHLGQQFGAKIVMQ